MNRHELFARTTAAAYRTPWLDADERRAIAMTAAWEAQTKLRPAETVPVITCRRITDELRNRYGRRAQGHTLPLPEWFDGPAADVEPSSWLEFVDTVVELSDGDARTASILLDLVCGHAKQDIAARHGITPGRGSQILAEVRAKAAS